MPITQPHVDKVDYAEDRPLKFRADLRGAAGIRAGHVQGSGSRSASRPTVTDADVEKTLEESRERAATFVPVEGRPLAKGDYAQLKLTGTPADGGEPLQADNVLCHLGAEETLEAFTENLRGRAARRAHAAST